jgi:hypothetical protein
VFSLWSVPKGCKSDKEYRLSPLSFEATACQENSLGAEELLPEELRESHQMAVEDD